jgi:hypothetical protein
MIMSNTNHSTPALANQPKRLDKLASIAVVRKCHRGQEICGQGQPAEYGGACDAYPKHLGVALIYQRIPLERRGQL